MDKREKLIELLEAVWAMCRKNELYTLEMFKDDMIGKVEPIYKQEIARLEKEKQEQYKGLEQAVVKIGKLEEEKEKNLSVMFQYRMLLKNKEEELARIKGISVENLWEIFEAWQFPESVNPESNPIIHGNDFKKVIEQIHNLIQGGGKW